MKIFLVITLLVAAGLVNADGQVPSADEIAEAGSFDGQMYTNKTLNLAILAPGGWEYFPYTQNKAVVDANRTKNKNLSSANTQILFQAMPPKALGGNWSATFSAGIERLLKTTTSVDYAKTNKALLLSLSPVEVTRDIYETKIGGVNFSVFEISGKMGAKAYRQTYYATVRPGVAVFFVATFYDNKNEFAAQASLKTLKFGK